MYITCNRPKDDENFYPKLWEKFPEAEEAFKRRVAATMYFPTLRKCEHITGKLRDFARIIGGKVILISFPQFVS